MDRVMLIRKPFSRDIDLDQVIKQVSKCTSHFVVLTSSKFLTVYLETSLNRSNFHALWDSQSSLSGFCRARFCSAYFSLPTIYEYDMYYENKVVYVAKPIPSTVTVTELVQCTQRAQNTPPPRNVKKAVKDLNEVKVHPSSLFGIPDASDFGEVTKPVSVTKVEREVTLTTKPTEHTVPTSPPFYLQDFVTYGGNMWKTNYIDFFSHVAYPEEKAFSEYLHWVEVVAPKFRCRLVCEFEDLEEMYYSLCEHPECHPTVLYPCPGCESRECKCLNVVLNNSWKVQYRRAVVFGNEEEAKLIKALYTSGVPNPPDILVRDRVRMQRESNYFSKLEGFTREQKIELCSQFCERLFRVPGASSCTTLEQLRKNLWKHQRHSSFFLRLYNQFCTPIAKICV
jgi:hypothetical protein